MAFVLSLHLLVAMLKTLMVHLEYKFFFNFWKLFDSYKTTKSSSPSLRFCAKQTQTAVAISNTKQTLILITDKIKKDEIFFLFCTAVAINQRLLTVQCKIKNHVGDFYS
jgi:hypothetical protein